MATYKPLTDWQVSYNTQSGTTWMGAAVRLVADVDASTATSYAVYAECSAYCSGGRSSATTFQTLPYYNGNFIGYKNATFGTTAGPVGEAYRYSLGTFAAGQTATSGTFRYRIDFTDYGSRWAPTSGTVTASYTVPSVPAAPTVLTNTRVSDTQNTVSWTLPETTYTRLRLNRIQDGSTTSASWALTGSSYADTGTSAGHSYHYTAALELVPELGEDFLLSSASVSSGTTYNSPVAPTAISGARISGSADTVRLTLTNTASTSTGLEVQASTSSSDWTGALSASYSGSGVTTADFSGVSGIYYFRARNTRGGLVSAWSPVSEAVVTLVAPNAPTLTAPTAAVWNFATPTVTFAWQHNPIDGSAQTAAQLQWSVDGGSTWATVSATTAQTASVTFAAANLNKIVTWRVRTKGAADDYGPYSATKQFRLAQAPSVTITLKDGNGNIITGGTLSDMPLVYELTVTDGSGSVASARVTLGGYSEDVDTSTLTGSITAGEFLPENGRTYSLNVAVTSTSSLQASASAAFTTDFVLPQSGFVSVVDDGGIETLTVGLNAQEQGQSAAASISVYRRVGSETVLLASGLASGATVIDRYAPLNKDYAYIVATVSAAGVVSQASIPARISSRHWMLLFGDSVARGRYNPKGSLRFSRPEKTRVRYVGRTWPVSYDGTALSDERSMSFELETLEERDTYIALMEYGGRAIYKSGDGDVFRADVEVSFSPAYTARYRYGSVSLSIVRVESEAL